MELSVQTVRSGIRMGDLYAPDFKERLKEQTELKLALLKVYGNSSMKVS